ncbi:MAG: hypothetical protein IPJ84_07920 [Bdellovibrionales bacterium]|nr:hypothetical protein [Bdellovibrionales bacterium]
MFVINTTEKDIGGGRADLDEDEAKFAGPWRRLYPDAKVIIIRRNSNVEITAELARQLEVSRGEVQIVGISIHSHGAKTTLFNESEEFVLRIPNDVETVLAPTIGKMAPEARVVFSGCEVLNDLSPKEATLLLDRVGKALKMSSGLVYANSGRGGEMMDLFKVNQFNPRISREMKTAALISYALWPVAVPLYGVLDRYHFNNGKLLELSSSGEVRLFEMKYEGAFEPSVRALKDGAPIYSDNLDEKGYMPHFSNQPGVRSKTSR